METMQQNGTLNENPIQKLNRKSRRQGGAVLSSEFLFYIIVLIVLSVLAAMAYKPAMSMFRAGKLTTHLSIITKAVDSNYAHSGVYTNLDMDKIKHDLPSAWDDGTNVAVGVNPWGGNYTCAVGAVAYNYTCTATNVGVYDSKRIIDQYKDRVQYNPSTKVATFNYGEA